MTTVKTTQAHSEEHGVAADSTGVTLPHRAFPGWGGWWLLAVQAVLYVVFLLTDPWTYPRLNRSFDDVDERIIPWSLAPTFGDFRITLFAGLLIWLLDRPKRRWIPVLLLAVALPGVTGNILKKLTCRIRPEDSGGQTIFHGPFQLDNSSHPSGEAIISASNACALGMLYPPARPVFVTVATLTSLSRIRKEKHFLSDVFLGFILGWYLTRASMVLLAKPLRARRKEDEAGG